MKNQNKLIIRIFLLSFILSQTLFANLEKVSLQLEWKHQFEFAGFYTAIEKGYYNDVGLEVEIKEF
ncbi:MAG: ABC transporter substrate-binding protein, partial [Arcobacter sp.]|nr:ABC transporter substrate-binding protein [Arcobacter sp.]